MVQPGGVWGGGVSQGDQCGMMDQCCGMAEQGCCQEQGQKCYTVYERKCRYANKPVCQTMTREFLRELSDQAVSVHKDSRVKANPSEGLSY